MLKKMFMFAMFATLSFATFAAQAKTIEIDGMDTLRFSEASITVKAGEKVTVKLVNNTKLPGMAMSHNWVLLAAGVDAKKVDEAATAAGSSAGYIPAGMDKQILAHTDLVAGGESKTVTFTAPQKPGDYEYICTFPGHFGAGMKGTLVVTAK